jgi:hypothetical protein
VTEREWDALVRSGRQAEFQARQILARPLAAWEYGTPQETWWRWAVAVLEGAAVALTAPTGGSR